MSRAEPGVSGSGSRVGAEVTVGHVKCMGRTRACQSYVLLIL